MNTDSTNSQPRTAVVTGGTRGIGKAISEALAARGYSVIAVATSEPATPPAGAVVRLCDVTDETAVAELFAEFETIDVLVNNAGISSSNPLKRTSLDEWDRQLAVNATGPFLCTRAVIAGMVERGHGRVVTVGSIASLEGAKYISAYAASKHAVVGLMRVLAAEVAGTGVTANSVCPTYVRTDMTETTIANIAEQTGTSLASAEAKLAESTPHNRIIEIAEVADAVLGLIESDHNGHEILLDGGLT
ncbi:MAG: SDR family oxidoreductase [Acidimicrobiales bacterium]